AEALRGAALDLALDRLGIDRSADVLGRPDPYDARQPELDVHLRDDAHGSARVGHVGALAGDLAGLGVERRRARVPVDAREADAAPHALATGRVARAARKPDRVARKLLGRRHLELGAAADDLGDRQRPGDLLARR